MMKKILPDPALPPYSLLVDQAAWLAPARSRLLRRVGIAHRRRVLDLGAGFGVVAAELARRSSGYVVALDTAHKSLREISNPLHPSILPVNGDGRTLPFSDNFFDLVFCQCALMWINPVEVVLGEIERTLRPGGALVALEPDYGGLIEHPPSLVTRDLWLSALETAGADPFTGRKLPELLSRLDLTIRIFLLDELQSPALLRFEFLHGLPLTEEQRRELNTIERHAAAVPLDYQVAHLPFFLITAEKKDDE